jgi:hypothetical protein
MPVQLLILLLLGAIVAIIFILFIMYSKGYFDSIIPNLANVFR